MFFNKKLTGSLKSGSGGSIVTSMSDLERIERVMNSAHFANKSMIKYMTKHIEEFRREMQYAKELILSDLQSVSEAMTRHAKVNVNPNVLTKNFQGWNRAAQPMTAEAIINESLNSDRPGSFMTQQ